MIEQVLRKELAPLIKRHRQLRLTRRLTVCWLVAALVGLVLLGMQAVLGWPLWPVALVVGIATLVVSVGVTQRVLRWGPDYQAVAAAIDRDHPDTKALILAAIEQRPATPISEMGYLQRAVIKEALVHATLHDWGRSVPRSHLAWACAAQSLVLVLLVALLSQFFPAWAWSPLTPSAQSISNVTTLTVRPGDTSLEQGASVVITARFQGPVPSEAVLVYGPAQGGLTQRQFLNKNLSDPVFGGMLMAVDEDTVYHIEYQGRQSPSYRLSVFGYPEMLQADAHIVYPAYTELPDKTLVDTRRIGVVEGSRVSLDVTVNKPVVRAQLVGRTGRVLDLIADGNDAHLYHAQLTAERDERFEVVLQDADGRLNKLPPRLVMEVHENLPPELKVTFPSQDTEVSPLEELTLEAQVADDYGLTGYGLSYLLAGLETHELPLGTAGSDQTMQMVLSLEDLQAEPDQLLTYYFWADDIAPDGRARRTTSDMYFAEVRHFEEIFRESESFQDEQQQRQQQEQQQGEQGQQQEDLLQLQKQIVTATWNLKRRMDRRTPDEALSEDLALVRDSQAEARDLARSTQAQAQDAESQRALGQAGVFMEQALEALDRVLEAHPGDEMMTAVAAERAAYQELLKLGEQEYNITQARNNNRANNGNSNRFEQQLRQLNLRQREDRYETQRLAQNQAQPQQRENLQVMNRLKDLARRQQEMSDRLREAQAALQQAQDEQERQEAQRELKRLRDEQQQALEDADRLQQRMERPENRQRMAEARQRMEQTRQRMQEANEQLREGQVSQAVTNTTRAQRELEQMREDLRRGTANQFSEQMRDMRRTAQDLSQQQQDIAEQLRQQMEDGQPRLIGDRAQEDLAERLSRQRQDAEELLDQMRDVSQDAEEAEPLLSRKLYDTLRQASTDGVDQTLETTRQLVERNFLPEAQRLEQQARAGLDQMREGIEDAARGVLGDEAEALRLARSELDDLIRDVQQEAQQRSGEGEERRRGREEERMEEEAQETQSQESGLATAQSQTEPDWNPLEQWGGDNGGGPFTGGDYLEWSDRLRDVEEMLEQEELRNEAARVRDRAQTIRAEFTRHGTEPQWDVVADSIMGPLMELRQEVAEQLARMQSEEALVPIDRDPVPDRYAEQVRRYFESLGERQP